MEIPIDDVVTPLCSAAAATASQKARILRGMVAQSHTIGLCLELDSREELSSRLKTLRMGRRMLEEPDDIELCDSLIRRMEARLQELEQPGSPDQPAKAEVIRPPAFCWLRSYH